MIGLMENPELYVKNIIYFNLGTDKHQDNYLIFREGLFFYPTKSNGYQTEAL
ncbi:hypothetical protein D1BOALGB6SA_2423 [Olavius sp. associated proteobacterium Delta 1]|nr:hypothetical protein D1BOALGB6SA_2423 [Olavius sp. associated proteobacterium Delta 1]